MNRSHEYARRLLQKAREDAQAMILLMEDASSADWVAGFHAQQAVEKSLKAALTAHSIEYPLTHNLSMLLDQARAAGLPLPPDAMEIPKLTPFGTILRYEVVQAASTLDRAWAQGVVHRTLSWAEDLLGAAGERQ